MNCGIGGDRIQHVLWRALNTKLIKENSDIFGDFIFEYFNSSVYYSIFPSPMKNAIITPVYKKGTKTSKDKYRPVSILSNISKIY